MNSGNNSLYVGDLHHEVTEQDLYNTFSTVGPIQSIRICQNILTNRSLGYAYVNFQKYEDAEKALDTLNFELILGAPIRIMWSRRDPSIRKSGVGNIFIKNLSKEIDNKTMFDTFSAFGNILSCKVVMDANNISKGFGFVHFDSEETAKLSIEKVNGMLLKGKKVYVGPFISRREREQLMGDKVHIFTNVYVKNLSESTTEDQLKELFGKYGKISSVKIMTNNDGKSREFGFVAFEEAEAAKKAVEELNDQEYCNKILYVARAQKKSERQQELKRKHEELRKQQINCSQGVNLYVKNLDDFVDDEYLRKEFLPHGTITSVKVMRENGKSKGFGFVCYSLPEEATKAVTEMNGRLLGSKPLYVALAQKKEDRKAQLNFKYMHSSKRNGQVSYFAPMNLCTHGSTFSPILPRSPVYPRWSTHNGISTASPPKLIHKGINGQQIQNGRRFSQQPVAANTNRTVRINANVFIPPQQAQTVPVAIPAVTIPAAARQICNGFLSPEQKRNIGEYLYPLISEMNSALAGKITGMLLETNDADLLNSLLEDHMLLAEKVNEAVTILLAHNSQEHNNQQ